MLRTFMSLITNVRECVTNGERRRPAARLSAVWGRTDRGTPPDRGGAVADGAEDPGRRGRHLPGLQGGHRRLPGTLIQGSVRP